jgi:two-component system, NarL family, response regulator NreC
MAQPGEQLVSQDQGVGPIRIVLADDHTLVRRGLRLLLDRESDFEVVAEAGDVETARRYVRGHHPAVLVLDLNMPGGSSLEAIPELREHNPDTQIVMLTMQQEPAFARRALSAGAIGYVLKEAASEELVGVVRSAARGEGYPNHRFGAQVASEMPPELREGPPPGLPQDPPHPLEDLPEHGIEVLR